MRMELEFVTDEKELPIEYRRVFISFLKSCIQQCNEGAYMDKYYEPGKEKGYSFAVFFDNPQFLKEKIQLGSNRVRMIFSTADKLTGFIFYTAFLENKHKTIPIENDNKLTLVRINEVKQRTVTGNEALFQILSPLCIRKHIKENNQDVYYSYISNGFEDMFKQVVKKQLEGAGFTEEYTDNLTIEPISCKKVIVSHYQCKLECTLGKIILRGNKAVLQYLYNAGLGSRKSSGFGLLELLSNG